MQIGENTGIFFDNTLRIKQLAEQVGIPEIPKGKEQFLYNVGETVESSGIGPLKEGVKVKIVERYMQHGYAYYVAENGQTHRTKDLRPVS